MELVKQVITFAGISEDTLKKVKGERPPTILKECFQLSQPSLIPSSAEIDAEASQWINEAILKANDKSKEYVDEINTWLSSRSYMAGTEISLADIVVLYTLTTPNVTKEIKQDTHNNLIRWMMHICKLYSKSNPIDVTTTPQNITIPVFKAAPVVVAAKDVKDGAKDDNKNTKAIDKKEKGDDKVSKDKTATTTTVADGPDPSKLEFRVGKVVKCYNHPESEKLLCEEIDLGEGEGKQRLILSGIRAFYKAEEVQDRLVIVVANLKERNMGGMKSQGMVLCAVNSDHTQVKLLEAPVGSEPGELVTFNGYSSEPATPGQVNKKKILEGILPLLRTDEEGVAGWNNIPMTLKAGVVKAPLSNVAVS